MTNDPEHAQFPPPSLQLTPLPPTPVDPAPVQGVGAPSNHAATRPAASQGGPRTIRPLDTASVEVAAGAKAGIPWGGPAGTQPQAGAQVNEIQMTEAIRTGGPMMAVLGQQTQRSTAGGTGARTLRPGGQQANTMNRPDPNDVLTPGVQVVGGAHPGGFDPEAFNAKRNRASSPNRIHPGSPQPARSIAQTHDATDPYGTAQGARAMSTVQPQIYDATDPRMPTGGAPRPATHAVTANSVQVNNPMDMMAAGGGGMAPGVQEAVINRGPQSPGGHSMAASVQPQGMPQQPFTMPAMQGGPGMSPHSRPRPQAVQAGGAQFPGNGNVPTFDGPVQPIQPAMSNPTLQGPPVPRANPAAPQAMQPVTPTVLPAQGEIASSEQGAAIMVTPDITPLTLDSSPNGPDPDGPVAPVAPLQPTIQPDLQDVQPADSAVPQPPFFYQQAPSIEQGPAAPQQPAAPVNAAGSAPPPMQINTGMTGTQQPMPAGETASGMHVNPGSVSAAPAGAHAPVTQPVAAGGRAVSRDGGNPPPSSPATGVGGSGRVPTRG